MEAGNLKGVYNIDGARKRIVRKSKTTKKEREYLNSCGNASNIGGTPLYNPQHTEVL
jgi:hypothetical protein